MRFVIALALAGCQAPLTDGDFPIDPGTGSGDPTGRNPDAAVDAFDPDALSMLAGRVCLVSDLRGLSCAATGAGGITVTLGTRSTTTAENGSFTILLPGGSNLVWRASGNAIAPSVMAFGPSTTIPAIGAETYLELQNANSVVLQALQGSIVARIVRGNFTVSGATVEPSPDAQFATRYDGATPTAWTELATGASGVAWIAGAPIGTSALAVTPPTGVGASEVVLVEDQAITYVTIDLP